VFLRNAPRQVFGGQENMAKINTNLSGISGEYLVASELSRRGYIATVTLKNTKNIDILVAGENSLKLAGIQVKTNQKHRLKWLLKDSNEKITAEHLFYVFVNLNNGTAEKPDYYVVPSKIVAIAIKEYHKDRIRHGVKDTSMRVFIIGDESKYKDCWDILNLD
jgi:hypothetical protein